MRSTKACDAGALARSCAKGASRNGGFILLGCYLLQLDHFMPIVRTSVSNLNKLCVTESFLDLIKQHQGARMASQTELYHKLRNRVNRMAASLRKLYYEKKVAGLRKADSYSWWRKTKQFLCNGQTPFTTYNGNTHT